MCLSSDSVVLISEFPRNKLLSCVSKPVTHSSLCKYQNVNEVGITSSPQILLCAVNILNSVGPRTVRRIFPLNPPFTFVAIFQVGGPGSHLVLPIAVCALLSSKVTNWAPLLGEAFSEPVIWTASLVYSHFGRKGFRDPQARPF
jgi:hypothetical protein